MKHFLAFILVLGSVSLCMGAEGIWCAVTDKGESLELSRVSCLVAADDADVFSILLVDGSAVDNVKNIEFSKLMPTAVSLPVNKGCDIMFNADGVGNTLKVINLPPPCSRVAIMSLDGHCLIEKSVGSGRDVILDVSALSPGYYILSVGSTAIKFCKK